MIHVSNANNYPVREITCAVKNYQELSGHVLRVILQQPPTPIIYCAGQYVEILPDDGEARPFSIASAPDTQQFELHIRHFPDNPYTTALAQQLKVKKQLTVKGPFGNMHYQREPAYPLIFIAGGTGFAPFKALLEELWRDPTHPPVYLYWGARTRADLYWHDQLQQWAKTQRQFYYCPILSQPKSTDQWAGAVGLVHEYVLQQHTQFNDFHVYASGPPEMVFTARDALLEQQLDLSRFYSDWLDIIST